MELVVDDEIILKTQQLDDIKERYQVIDENRDFIKKWLRWPDFYKQPEDLIEYTKACQEKEKNGESYAMGIYYKNEYVGSIEIMKANDKNKKCEIGYWLSKKYNGKGIMTRSCRAVIEYAFNTLDLNKVSILAATENFASQAIPERLKFIKEGTLRENEYLYGKFIDCYTYGMTRKMWQEINCQ